MKTVFDIMDSSDKALESFYTACDDMCASRFILAEKKISYLLQIIASSRKLYDIMHTCTNGFDFSNEFSKAQSGNHHRGTRRLSLRHLNRREQIAFAFCLLYSFDTKKLDLQEFVHTYFKADTINSEFTAFCKAIIAPLKENIRAEHIGEPDPMQALTRRTAHSSPPAMRFSGQVKRLIDDEFDQHEERIALNSGSLNGGATEDLKNLVKSKQLQTQDEKVNHQFDESENDQYISDEKIEVLNYVLESLLQKIQNLRNKMTQSNLLEIDTIVDAFSKALDFGGVNSVTILSIALKNTLKASTASVAFSSEIVELTEFINGR